MPQPRPTTGRNIGRAEYDRAPGRENAAFRPVIHAAAVGVVLQETRQHSCGLVLVTSCRFEIVALILQNAPRSPSSLGPLNFRKGAEHRPLVAGALPACLRRRVQKIGQNGIRLHRFFSPNHCLSSRRRDFFPSAPYPSKTYSAHLELADITRAARPQTRQPGCRIRTFDSGFFFDGLWRFFLLACQFFIFLRHFPSSFFSRKLKPQT